MDTPGSTPGASDDHDASVVPTPAVPEPISAGSEPYLFTIGDIAVTQHWIVTPNGSAPIRESRWIVFDHTRTESKIPAYAIVLAIVFALFCLVGLLFLLIKEQHTTGYVEVSVMSGSLSHATQIPISGNAQTAQSWIAQVRYTVQQAQSLAFAAQHE